MPSFLVEAYAADPKAVADARARATALAGRGVRHVRTTFLPTDETVLHFFEAPSGEALQQAVRRACLRYNRIVVAVEEAP